MDSSNKRYAVLSAILALMGATIAALTAAVYVYSYQKFHNPGLIVALAGCSGVLGIYYISVHQFLKKKHLQLSAAIISALAGVTVLLLIAATGGVDSPYYALWLLGIVVAGFFGRWATGAILAVTLVVFGVEYARYGWSQDYLVGHVGQIIMTIGTAVVAEWIHRSLGRGAAQHKAVTQLTGQLTAESLKSEVLMQSVGEGVLVVNTSRQIEFFNPAAVRLTGWDVGSAKGIDYRLVLGLRAADGNKLSDNDDPFTQVWSAGKSLVRSDLTMETKGGRKIAISLSLSPIVDHQNRISGGIALFRDISAEKEVERQRTEFISTASHEMRTPVAAIEGYLSLAMNPAVATIDERAKGYLDKAHTSTQHLGELFRDLLTVTKTEDVAITGQEIFDLGDMLKEAVGDMKFQADKKGVELQLGSPDQRVRGEHSMLPVYAVKANPQRLREVINNLMENALKFTSQGSVRIAVGGTSDTVTVSITDTGIGIAPEDISHLFQKFYRVDSSATRTIGGTGLGLYLCRSIIEKFGGRIWVESQLGAGSSFKFTLPRQDSQKIKKASTTVAPAPLPTAERGELPPAPVPGTTVGKALTDIKKPAGVS